MQRINNKKSERDIEDVGEHIWVFKNFFSEDYIDELLEGDAKIIGFEDGRKTAKWADPLDAIRGQYTPGEDF